ncbi:6-pyruvoyl-tetrahydropterin synthase-related protein [Desulfococcaceae bacterium HSG8]|nr:6-pyruvoyl-tetrahydropterin synthase-related protein [Desulfococcaceae bacterium HSG8]
MKISNQNSRFIFSAFFPLIFILLCIQSAALAGEITLVVENTTRVTGQQVNSEFRLINQGTDTAWNVKLQAAFSGQEQTVSVGRQIAPGASETAKIRFELPRDAKGEFPIFSKLYYNDPTGTSFSSATLAVVRTPDAPKSGLTMNLKRDAETRESPVRAELTDPEGILREAILTCHLPDDLTLDQRTRRAVFRNGKAGTRFHIRNLRGLPGSRYGVFITAEYDHEGNHYFVYSSIAIPVEEAPAVGQDALDFPYKRILLAPGCLILMVLLTALVNRRMRKVLEHRFGQEKLLRLVLDILAILAIEGFILSNLSPQYLMTQTITTGGDTASHYYTLEYLRHELLPEGKIGGWTPGNYAGFPILQFYFPLPFLIMCTLDMLIPLQVAFKWGSLLGVFLLPLSIYIALRYMRCPFPGPAIGASFSLPFLFNSSNSMWGGNILSTLAGEFSYSLSLSLTIIFLGSLWQGCTENRHVIRNAFLVFLVGFSHGYTLLFAEAMSLFFLITPRYFVRRASYLLKVYALGFFFLAFWLVPLILFIKHNTAFHVAWVINSIKEILPDILLPVIILAGVSSIGLLILSLIRTRETGSEKQFPVSVLGFLWFGLLVAFFMFVAAPKLGVVDIRYVPCGQLMACLLAAMGPGWLAAAWLRRWKLDYILLLIMVAAAIAWTIPRPGPAPEWTKWNYEGFEAKPAWPLYRNINEAVRGTFQEPRVVYEHSSHHNAFGTTRAFESLPFFSGRATLEGLYMQASLSAPFVFYIQSEVSKEISCPFKQYICTDMNFGRAVRHLEMFNVRELIMRSQEAKNAIRTHPEYRLLETLGEYEIWELASYQHRYVVPLEYEPVLYSTQDWKTDAYRWFTRDDVSDVHLVFTKSAGAAQEPFKTAAKSLKALKKIPIDTRDCRISETIRNNEILIRTNWIGRPLLVRVSYHPNWRVEGAEKIWLVSPSFMLIFPTQENVRLYYGSGWPKHAGLILTGLGLIILMLNIPLPREKGRTGWIMLANRLGIPESPEIPLEWNPSLTLRRAILGSVLFIALLSAGWGSYRVYSEDPNRWFNEGVKLRDAKRFDEAREKFRKIIRKESPMSGLVADSAYFIAICHYLENDNRAAIKAFEELIEKYPHGSRNPEAYYHIGLCYLRTEAVEQGIAQLRLLTGKYPNTIWAGYAKDRLREYHALDEKVPPLTRENLPRRMGEAIRFFNQDRLDDAKPIFREISMRFPDFEGAPQALACLALISYKKGNYAETISHYRQLVDRYPDNKLVPESHYHIGLSYGHLGEREKAKQAYQKGASFSETQFGKLSAEKLSALFQK